MSINSQIERIENNVKDAFDTVVQLGGSAPATYNSDNLASAISTIPQSVEPGGNQFVTLEKYGGIANDSSASARQANTQAVTQAILDGYNICCPGGASLSGARMYYFSGIVDVRAVQYRNIDINLNGCRFNDFHIISNIIDDAEMQEDYCTWKWQNGNKFLLKIHDGLIGATNYYERMKNRPDDPIAITGHIPYFYNLQVLGHVYLLAMPPVYCDQLYMDNIKGFWQDQYFWRDTHECICVIRGIDSNGNYIYKNNGEDGKGVNGDQFIFSRLNDCRNFFTIWNCLGTSVRNTISASFAINKSFVEMTHCHAETELLYSIIGGTMYNLVMKQCYFNQQNLAIFNTLSAENLRRTTFENCVIRYGNVNLNYGELDSNFLSFMLNAKSGELQLHVMGRNLTAGRIKTPAEVYCTSATINTVLDDSASGVFDANGANYKKGSYNYITRLHTVGKLDVIHSKEDRSVTITNQLSYYRQRWNNYAGQMITMYKTDSSGNKYRCIIPSYNFTGNIFLDDCGSFVSVWTYDVNFPPYSGRVSDAYAWEKVNSIPTVTTNTKLRQNGSMIYDVDGNIYNYNMVKITSLSSSGSGSDSTPDTPATPLRITAQPASVSTTVGSFVMFFVSATGDGLIYQWQYNNGSGWKNWSGGTGRSLTINPVSESQNGLLLRCIVSDDYGNSATSDEATLTVSANESDGDVSNMPTTVSYSYTNAFTENGALASSRFWVSDWIEVPVGYTVVLSGDTSAFARIAYWNEQFEFTSTEHPPIGASGWISSYTVSATDRNKYVKFFSQSEALAQSVTLTWTKNSDSP